MPLWTLLVAAGVWIPLVVKAIRNLRDGCDYTILASASRDLWSHGLPYGGGEYMYPPFFATVLGVVAYLPDSIGGSLWALAKIPLFYFAAASLLPRGLLPDRIRIGLIGLSPVLVYRFLDSDLVNGNTNVFLLAGIAASWRWSRGPRQALAASCLAAVASVKLSPGYLVAMHGASGRWRFAALSGGIAVLLLVLPCFLVKGGVAGSWEGFRSVNRNVISRDGGEVGGYLPGQSLRPILHRYLTPIDATAHDGEEITVHLLSWSTAEAERVYLVVAALLGIGGLWAARGRSARWGIAWGCLTLLLISPYSRKAHFLLQLPACLLALECLLGGAVRGRGRWLIWGSLGTAWALGNLTAPAIWGKAGASLWQAHGATGLAAMAILPAMWIIRAHDRGP